MTAAKNIDALVTTGFGDEWARFDQSALSPAERQRMFDAYFQIFPWHTLSAGAVGADFGCGSGRWAALVAPRAGRLYCIDASPRALDVARRNLAAFSNCEFVEADIGEVPLPKSCLDFGYSLGVLHHLPDTAAGLVSCVDKLKRGAPFLLYLYYRFDNRPAWYRGLWYCSDACRRVTSRLPFRIRATVSEVAAVCIYWPLARLASLLERAGMDVSRFPLAYYRSKPLYVMRTDALDRFGTRLEQRFTRHEIEEIMEKAGLTDVKFSDKAPFWCAVGVRA
jgi:SAM-dependent methyltransferase